MNRGVIVLKGLQGVVKEQLADAILLKLVSEFLPGSEGGGCLKTSPICEVLRDKIEVLLDGLREDVGTELSKCKGYTGTGRKTGIKPGKRLLSAEEKAELMKTVRYQIAFDKVCAVKKFCDEKPHGSLGQDGYTPVMLGVVYREFLDEFPELTQSDLCRALQAAGYNSDVCEVSDALNIIKLPEPVLSLCLNNRFGNSTARALHKLVEKCSDLEIIDIAEKTLKYQPSADALRIYVDYYLSVRRRRAQVYANHKDYIDAFEKRWFFTGKKFTKPITVKIIDTSDGGILIEVTNYAPVDIDIYKAKLSGYQDN
jgi:hypothetical protein